MSGGSTTTTDSTSNQTNQIPAWMSNAGEQNYALAQQIAQQPLQQYQGQMVADIGPQMQQSWNVAANSGNVGADQFNAATGGYLGALAQTPTSVTAGQVGDADLSKYMNPYTQDVINATLPKMEQENALSQNQQANAANSSNAFGGSRQGIQQGVAQAQGAMNIGQMLAGLNSANFTQAQAAATGDINRTLSAQQGNQTADQQKINSDILASQGLTNTGQQMNASNVANFNMLQSAGAAQQMQAQNQINAQMAKFNQAFNYPQQQLGVLESSLGMTPHDTSTSGQSSTAQTTPTDWASIISKGAGAAADIYGMSDKTMKTDITKLGKDPKTGIEMHAFRYKGDPKSYPKVVGPMAQEVEEKYPGSTTPMGAKGKLAIRGYAGGTPYVDPGYAPFLTTPRAPGGVNAAPIRSYADGTSYVTPIDPGHAIYLTTPRAPGAFNGAPVPEDHVRAYAGGTAFVQPDMPKMSDFSQGAGPDPDWSGGYHPRKSITEQFDRGRTFSDDDNRAVGMAGARYMLEKGYAEPQHYAGGTAFVAPPSLAAFTPPSSPGVAKGILAMSAFRPPVRFARGAGVPKMQKFAKGTSNVQPSSVPGTVSSHEYFDFARNRSVQGFADGSAFVAPDMNDAALGDQIAGGDTFGDSARAAQAAKIRKLAEDIGGAGKTPSAPAASPMAGGWGAPSMGYFQSGYAAGTPGVLGSSDTVPAMLTPGEAVLTAPVADHIGRGNIARLNAMMPHRSASATGSPRAGARGIAGALANTKLRPKVAGGLA